MSEASKPNYRDALPNSLRNLVPFVPASSDVEDFSLELRNAAPRLFAALREALAERNQTQWDHAAAKVDVDRLQRIIDGMAARIAAQSELLGKAAEK